MNTGMNIQNHNSYLLVDLAQLRRNALTILEEIGENTELIPVLKDDAYGLGLLPVARTLCEFPAIRTLAVAHVSEGLELRAAGIDREILVMGGAVPFQLEAVVEADLTLACGHPGSVTALAQSAAGLGKRAKAQIKLDTGLHRIGFGPEELEALIRELSASGETVQITGAFSHFSNVTDPADNEKEFAAFLASIARLGAHGIEIPRRHMACSASSELWPRYNLDAVRCGRRLYMDNPDAPTGKIRELASWRAFITQVKPRRAGETIGYGAAVTLKRDSLIATVGVGYGDGLNQALFRVQAPVLVNGQYGRLLACCMDQCMLDVTDISCAAGDEVCFFGYDGQGNFLSSQRVSSMVNRDEGCGLTSALSRRVARVYQDLS